MRAFPARVGVPVGSAWFVIALAANMIELELSNDTRVIRAKDRQINT